MKKLMFAMAIAMVAAMSQAASMSWSVADVINDQSVKSGGLLVLLYDSGYTFDFAEQKASQTATYYATSAAQGTTGKFNVGQQAVGSFGIGESASLYAVVLNAGSFADASAYIVSGVKSATVGSAGKDITLNFGAMTATATSAAFYGKTWQSVPEPTSGLLLLLGMAGLALRRRRA